MKLALMLFISFFTSTLLAQSLCPTQNHILLIHGIGGSARTFGHLDKVLKKWDICHEVHSFEYDTGNSSLSTYDFAESFHHFLSNKIAQGLIKTSDKISLIMHSQGGLVGNLWLNLVREKNPFLYQQVNAFITLSTPHWGAEIANVGRHFFFTLPEGVKNPLSPFGRIELNEMSYGSATIRNLSTLFFQNFRPVNFRPLAVGGIHKIKNKLIGENDAVVPVYSSRPDNFFGEVSVNINESSGHVPASAFTKTNRMPFVMVPATHLKMDLPGIASIPESCLKNCDHPALPVISEHLKGRSIASIKEKLDHFRISIYLTNGTGDKIEKKNVDLDIVDDKNIRIPLNQKLKNFRGEAKLEDGLAFSFHGYTKKEGIQTLRVRLKIKHKIERTIDIPVEGGYSSLLQIKIQ